MIDSGHAKLTVSSVSEERKEVYMDCNSTLKKFSMSHIYAEHRTDLFVAQSSLSSLASD